ncbi:hypothetical protein GGI21_004854, partial [Coemansia aciculifera]
MSLYQNIVPDNRILLRACKPEVAELLKDYVPVAINFYSSFRRVIYSKISFKRNYDGQWSDSVNLITARYPSGSKQWLVFPTMPLPDDYTTKPSGNTPLLSSNATSPKWVRTNLDTQYCRNWQFRYSVPDARDYISSTSPLIDEESEDLIEDLISKDFCRLHGTHDDDEVPFAPAHPQNLAPRGDMFDRVYHFDQHAIDTTPLQMSETMLKGLDLLDSMDRPFSTQVGVVYLRSPESLMTKRGVAKGPLKGVGPYFNQFLNQLSLSQTMPVERIKLHPEDPTLMRYSFCLNNFEVCYGLAPNVSELISGSKMGPKDNHGFYSQMSERGISILWFDSHPGALNQELAWQFLSSFDDEHSEQRYDKSVEATTLISDSLYTANSSAGSTLKSRNQSNESAGYLALSKKNTVASAPLDKPAQTAGASGSGPCRLLGCKNETKRTHPANTIPPHRSKAREFFQKAMHITRRQVSDISDNALSQYSSTESSVDD